MLQTICVWVFGYLATIPIALFIVGKFVVTENDDIADKKIAFKLSFVWPLLLAMALLAGVAMALGRLAKSGHASVGRPIWNWFCNLSKKPEPPPMPPHVGDYRERAKEK